MEPEKLPQLSIVIPCYNEEDVLPETAKRLLDKLSCLRNQALVDDQSKIYFVDDGSRDATWQMIELYSKTHSEIKGIKLSRNRGHQNALLAGLMTAQGDVLISVDADLQDDLDAIDKMLKKHQQGCEIVYGVRNKRQSDTAFKRMTAQGYYTLLGKMGVDLVYNHAIIAC